ncbi:MAG: regulatory protein GemA [Methylicorpusculum sp.]|uniref:regulatory protein GemA n=1 Tax=Methylicorpusculum sp. TaxID=2713644 RepID=UPI00272F8215|nr:regulatory protein GemA [Methylicorpusculum sp.]MDP2202279.1 regulatory protein GemA [Methylicorpusculum sp.]
MTDLTKHYRQLVGIAKGWACKHLPGWTDELHRDLLARHGGDRGDGRPSANNLNLPQLSAVLDDYTARGWPRRKTYTPKGAYLAKTVSPQISHIVKLWGKLGQAGKVNNAGRPALLAFCARQTGKHVPDLDSLTTEEGQAIIEALKAWMAR